MSELRRIAEGLGIHTGLSSCKRTHFTSLHTCAGSVLALKDAFFDFVGWEEGKQMLPSWLLEQIEDSNGEFWVQLEVLWAISAPYSELIVALQAGPVSMADFTRYWISLARQLLVLSQHPSVPVGEFAIASRLIILTVSVSATGNVTRTDVRTRLPSPFI